MKVLIWNGRRIGKVEKQREAKDYIRAQEADLIGLVETKVRSGKAARITRCLGKDCSKLLWRMKPRPADLQPLVAIPFSKLLQHPLN